MIRTLTIALMIAVLGLAVALAYIFVPHGQTAAVAHQPPRTIALVATPTVVIPATPTTVPTSAPTATAAPTVTPAPTATPVPPAQPVIQSSTNPDPKRWYSGKAVTVNWSAGSSAPVAGYSYAVDQSPAGAPPQANPTQSTSATLPNLKDGSWYIHVRALGTSGEWGPVATFQINLDRVPLTVTTPKFSTFTFNPSFFTQDVWFNVSKPAQITVQVKDAKGVAVRTFTVAQTKAGEVDLTWDGKTNSGALASAGQYSYDVLADDGHGHQATSGASGLGVTADRIVVSLSKQSLTAYDGATPVLTSLVTTGNQLLPTPVGVFPVLGKYSPFTFHSPWPQGSPFWYPDSPVSYALLFDDRGYYIHDAPWRSNFGPGSNTEPGAPGQNLTGSHGCVNVPLAIAKQLYAWAPTGTAVQVVP